MSTFHGSHFVLELLLAGSNFLQCISTFIKQVSNPINIFRRKLTLFLIGLDRFWETEKVFAIIKWYSLQTKASKLTLKSSLL